MYPIMTLVASWALQKSGKNGRKDESTDDCKKTLNRDSVEE